MPENGYNQWCMKNSKLYILIALLAALLSGTILLNSNVPETDSTEPAVTETAETEPKTDETDGTDRKETEEDQEKPEKLVYEAVFLDSEDVKEVFRDIRGDDAPYKNVPSSYHVTVYYMPDQWMQKFYGKKVSVVCTRYQYGEVPDRDGELIGNEGVLVELKSDDPELQSYLDASEDQIFHITGSYEKYPKYTMNLDFSRGREISYTIEGTFGVYIDGGKIRLNPYGSGTDGQ